MLQLKQDAIISACFSVELFGIVSLFHSPFSLKYSSNSFLYLACFIQEMHSPVAPVCGRGSLNVASWLHLLSILQLVKSYVPWGGCCICLGLCVSWFTSTIVNITFVTQKTLVPVPAFPFIRLIILNESFASLNFQFFHLHSRKLY